MLNINGRTRRTPRRVTCEIKASKGVQPAASEYFEKALETVTVTV